jgi:iron complex outermembrane receptor protein
MPADDANLARAPGHLLLDAGLWRDWMTSAGPLQLSLAVDNLADRRHVASVVVNDGNGRYYEPGAGRSWRLGLRWRWGGKRPG